MNSGSDTLVADTARLMAWRQDDAYAYDSEIVPSQMSLVEWLQRQVRHFFHTIFGSDFYQVHGSLIWVSVAIVAILAIAYFLWKRHPELFLRSRKDKPMEYEVTEDNIYGVDFVVEIGKAMERMDYREALRLIYLQTLRNLSDNQLLVWQPFKTPTQYTIEWRNAEFRQQTNLFVRVRYGNFEATSLMVEEMRHYQKVVLDSIQKRKGGEP